MREINWRGRVKLSLLNQRGQFSPRVRLGPVMWRCTNGHPNHAVEWCVTFRSYRHTTVHLVHLTPSLVFTPWHKSTLATIEPLGTETKSISLGIEWLMWVWSVSLLRTRNTKTQAEVDAGVERFNDGMRRK